MYRSSECYLSMFFFFFQAEDGIRDYKVTGVQTCALPISTIILTTHYLEEAETLCRNIAIINGGRIVERDRMSRLLRRGSEEHTSELQSPCHLVCRPLL